MKKVLFLYLYEINVIVINLTLFLCKILLF